MKTSSFISFELLLIVLLTDVTTILAQNKPKVGDIISGIVFVDECPTANVVVCEIDSTNKLVANYRTDEQGRFVFFIVNPNDRITVASSVLERYEKVSVLPIDTNYIEFKINRVIGEPGQEEMSGILPFGNTFVDGDSKILNWLKEQAPENYSAGYVLVSPFGSLFYSLFLVREKSGCSLVYKELHKNKKISINSELAQILELSVNSRFVSNDATGSRRMTSNDLDEDVMLYEGFTAYAVTLDKAVSFRTNQSKDIPDELWLVELKKFRQE